MFSVADATVTLKKVEYAWDGTAKKPAIVVELGGKKLRKDTDYTVTYSNNKNVGIAKCTVKGIGRYKGKHVSNFTIKYNLSKAAVWFTLGPDYQPLRKVVTGKQIRPIVTAVTVHRADGKKGLKVVPASMYKVSKYGKNKACGTGTVTVVAKNTDKCMGKAQGNFSIIPKKPKSVKCAVNGRNVTVAWKANGSVDGFRVTYSTENDIHTGVTEKVKSTSFSFMGDEHTKYYIWVAAIKNEMEGDPVKKTATTE